MSHRKAPPVRHDAPRMRGQRARTGEGALRQKRGDTHAKTIEDLSHVDLGVRGDKQRENILKDEQSRRRTTFSTRNAASRRHGWQSSNKASSADPFGGFRNRDTVFEFRNGRRWQQAEYKYHYHYARVVEGPGGVELSVDGVSDTVRVKRAH